MANVNSQNGYVSLPFQSITGTSATALLVPPASALYQGLPSPTLAAGSGLYIAPENDYQTSNPTASSPTYVNSSVDGHPFRVRIVGQATVGAASTFVFTLYNGTSSTAASDTSLAASTSYSITGAGTINFTGEYTFLWDSVSGKLNGYFNTLVNGVYTTSAATTQASPAVTALQFIPFFTFGTGNAANGVTVKEILIERV